ncbi:MAG: glycosyltransferase N-terminal domain-containing protein [Thermodesulfobacteriota bacterium]|nr:glycosyltransferase N-terminal domain-containing protein [Thermodesulfobacteriota bacterium]
MIRLYEKVTGAAYAVSRPFLELWSRLEGSNGMWSGRLGHLPNYIAATGPQDLWLHAVSVGEVAVAEALVQAIDRRAPGIKILVSVTTPAGFARAMSSLGARCSVIPYPLDFPQIVRRMASEVRPRVYACLETELWPNLVGAVRQFGGKTVLLNGRISARSFPRYLRLLSITRPLLADFSKICAISDIHANRLAALGAPMDRIQVTGNAKFEGLLSRPDPDRVMGLRNRLKIEDSIKVLVAGSLRGGEEKEVVSAYYLLQSRWSDMIFFLVPRHLKKVSSIVSVLNKKNIPYQLWSEMEVNQRRTAKVVVVDVIGPLFDLYGLATAAFVGGSLVPKGGQNLLEPAAWGCPVIYGPHTDNFEEARITLESHGGGQEVNNGKDLAEAVNLLFEQPLKREERGRRGRSALEALAKGVATKQTDILLQVLEA